MSNINTKLEHFNSIILKEAAARRDSILSQIRQEKKAVISSKKIELTEQADELLKIELQKIEKEKNDVLSAAFIESRQLLRKTREKIVKAVLSDLDHEIETFIQGKDYEIYLESCILKSCEQAGTGNLTVFLNETDINKYSLLLDRMQKQLKISIEKTDKDIKGGCEVLNKTANLYIDNSIASRIEQAKENFFQTSCLRIE